MSRYTLYLLCHLILCLLYNVTIFLLVSFYFIFYIKIVCMNPYVEIMHIFPPCFVVGQGMWMAEVPMICMDIVEQHALDRVL